MLHALVTPLEYFSEVLEAKFSADLKKDDRPYQPGDTVLLQEFNATTQKFTGRELPLELTNVKRNAQKDGLRNGFVLINWTVGELTTHKLPEGYTTAAAKSDEPNIADSNPI